MIARPLLQGLIGTLAPIAGVLHSLQENVLWGMQFASVTVGFAVGLLTFVSLWRKLRRKKAKK
jgi:dipeptide/tripeptide permease